MSRIRRRAEAALVLACAPIEDQLIAAKTDATNGGPDAQAVKREAMATMHQTRAWLRAVDELERLPRTIADLQNKLQHAQAAHEPEAAAQAPILAAQITDAEQRLARIRRQFGPLVQAMQELAAAGGES